MRNEHKIAILRADIIPKETVKEFTRWGTELPEDINVEDNKDKALSDIKEAIESHEEVEIRTTDLDALTLYNANKKLGRLYYSVPRDSGRKTTFVNVEYAKNIIGSYIIPWTSENIFDLMVDEDTYLKPNDEERVYFSHIDELYCGENKIFMVCHPIKKRE